MFVTELTSHESSDWLKVAAFINMYCAHAARGWQCGGARRGGGACDVARRPIMRRVASRRGHQEECAARRGARRTSMFVTELTSHELSG